MREGEWTFRDTLALYGRIAARMGPRGLHAWRKLKTDDVALPVPGRSRSVLARGASSDREVFRQIYIDREYRCVDHLEGVRTIIDAGANVGYSSAYFASRWPDAKILALEPDEGNFAILEKNVAGLNVECLKTALWSHETRLDFDCPTLGQGNEWGRQVKDAGSGSIPAIDVESLLDRYEMPSVDLLKVDIEGAEKTVFRDAPWVERVKNIVIELHSDEDRRVFFDAIEGRGYAIGQCEELTVCLSQPAGRSSEACC